MSLMLEEIHEQPTVFQRLLDGKPAELARLRRRFAGDCPALIVLVARGTSDNAALFARYLFEIALGIPTCLAAPSIATLYRTLPRLEQALVVGISQSGESTDINQYLAQAKQNGAFTVGITNESGSSIVDCVDETLYLQAGKEISVAATKTYGAELLMAYLLAQALGASIPDSALGSLPHLADLQLRQRTLVRQWADHHRHMVRAVVLGRGLNYANALELALKLMETSYIAAAGFSGADFAHGPIAMIEQGFPVLAFTAPGPTEDQTALLAKRLATAGTQILCIGPDTTLRGLPECFARLETRGDIPEIPGLPQDLLTPVPMIIPAQLFAAYLAEGKGLNPDKPRQLSKVTPTL